MALAACPALSDTLRIATLNTDLERDGPGLLLRDILTGKDDQLLALRDVVQTVSPDILILQGVDYDHDLITLKALRDWLNAGAPEPYAYIFARPPNTGLATGIDLNGDGRTGRASDAQGFGAFFGQGGMAILSRYPVDEAGVQDYTPMLWKDFPGALLPTSDGQPFPSQEAQDVQRLSSVAHWVAPVVLPSGPLTVLGFHATPPVFDGPEDRNGRRNHDELVFWQRYLDGAFGPAPAQRFVLAGVGNIDPVDGEGITSAITGLLSDTRLQNPAPMRPDGPMEDSEGQSGNPRLDTVAWEGPVPGHLRVSYVLPSADLRVIDAGVHWPAPDTSGAKAAATASAHRMVWIDLDLD